MAKSTRGQRVDCLATPARENSTAGNAHVAADARAVVPAIDDEVVALRFEADSAVDRSSEQLIARRGPQRFAQIRGILVSEAGMQRAGAGNPDPIAGLAKIMRHRRDETEFAAGLGDTDIAGGPPGIIGEVVQGILLR